MNRLRLDTLIFAPPEIAYELALTVPVQERALTKVHARAVNTVLDRPLQTGTP